MRNFGIGFTVLIGILAFLGGCTTNNTVTNPNPQLAGDISGYVNFVSVNGVSNDSGVTVRVEGDSDTAVTASNGLWGIPGLTTGSYNVDFSKPGYGLKKLIGVPFVFNSIRGYNTGSVTLYQIPTYTAGGISDSISSGYVYIKGRFSGDSLPVSPGYPEAYVFFDTSSNVSSNPQNYLSYQFNVSNSFSSPGFFVSVDSSAFINEGFKSGQTVYAVAYAGSIDNEAVGYTDSTTGRPVFTGLDTIPSNIISFTVP